MPAEYGTKALFDTIWRGLFSTSSISIITCIVTFAESGLFVLRLVVTDLSVFSNGNAGRWAADSRDFHAFATAAAVGLKHRADNRPRILLAGTSLMRAAFGAAARTEEIIAHSVRQDVDVEVLAAGANTVMHTLALLEKALETRGGLAVVGINVLTLGVSKEERRDLLEKFPLGFVANQARKVARVSLGSGGKVEPFGPPLHALSFYSSRFRAFIGNVFAGRRFEPETKFVFERRPNVALPKISLAPLVNRITKYLAGVDENADSTLAELEALIAHFRPRSDVKIVLLLDPLNMAVFTGPGLGQSLLDARDRLTKFAMKAGVDLVTEIRDEPLDAAIFLDYGHVANENARDRLRSVLAARIAVIMKAPRT